MTARWLRPAEDVLTCEAKSKTCPGLWLRVPGQFLHDATPRAQAFLARFLAPPQPGRAAAQCNFFANAPH